MSAPLLSLPVGEVMRLHPAFAAFITGADGGAAKPDKILGAWIANLSEENLGRIGMGRAQVFEHLNSLAAEVDAIKRAPAALASLRLLGGRDKFGARGKARSDPAAGRDRLHRRPDWLGQEPPARRY